MSLRHLPAHTKRTYSMFALSDLQEMRSDVSDGEGNMESKIQEHVKEPYESISVGCRFVSQIG